jgi:hypothetical protein
MIKPINIVLAIIISSVIILPAQGQVTVIFNNTMSELGNSRYPGDGLPIPIPTFSNPSSNGPISQKWLTTTAPGTSILYADLPGLNGNSTTDRLLDLADRMVSSVRVQSATLSSSNLWKSALIVPPASNVNITSSVTIRFDRSELVTLGGYLFDTKGGDEVYIETFREGNGGALQQQIPINQDKDANCVNPNSQTNLYTGLITQSFGSYTTGEKFKVCHRAQIGELLLDPVADCDDHNLGHQSMFDIECITVPVFKKTSQLGLYINFTEWNSKANGGTIIQSPAPQYHISTSYGEELSFDFYAKPWFWGNGDWVKVTSSPVTAYDLTSSFPNGSSSIDIIMITSTNSVAYFTLQKPASPKVHDPSTDLTYDQLRAVPERRPHIISLSNSPNPFNPSTEVSFTIPEPGYARLTIYDIMGRQVAKLADGWHDAGHHSVTWNGSNSPSGTYFYRLETPRQTFTRSMVLVK